MTATGLTWPAGRRKNAVVVQAGHRPVGQVLVAAEFVAEVGEEVVHRGVRPPGVKRGSR